MGDACFFSLRWVLTGIAPRTVDSWYLVPRSCFRPLADAARPPYRLHFGRERGNGTKETMVARHGPPTHTWKAPALVGSGYTLGFYGDRGWCVPCRDLITAAAFFFCSLPKEMIVDVLVAQLPVLLLYELLIAPTILFPKNSEAFGVLG